MSLSRVLVAAFVLAAGCGSPVPFEPDAAPVPPDAPPAQASSPAALVVSGGGSMTSTTYTLDVQIGEAMLPRPVAAGDTTLAPHGAIQP